MLLNTAFKLSKFNTKYLSQIARNLATTDVYVGNIPNSIDQNGLEEFVKEKIGAGFAKVKLATDRETGNSRGFGWISFEEKSGADQAVATLTGAQLEGRTLKVDISQPKVPRTNTFGDSSSSDAGSKFSTEPKQSVYVGNLSYETSSEELGSLVESLLGPGSYKDIRISMDRETGRSKGFAHIEFSSADEVGKAIEALTGKEINGRTLKVDLAQTRDKNAPRPERTPFAPRSSFGGNEAGGARNLQQHSVFIGNLAWSVDEALIKEMVDDVLGPNLYVNIRLALDRETGRSRGFGHIDFKDAESAARAVAELNDLEVEGRQIRADHAQSKTGSVSGGAGRMRGGPGGFRNSDRYNDDSAGAGNDTQKW